MKTWIFLLMLVILSSISYGAVFKTYVVYDKPKVDSNKFLTFVIPQESTSREKMCWTIKKKMDKREYNIKFQNDMELLEKCLREKTKNWKRDVSPKGFSGVKEIYGYDEELDRSFKKKLWTKIRDGEKVC